MLVQALSYDRPIRRFSKSRGLSANPLPALLLASFPRGLWLSFLVVCSENPMKSLLHRLKGDLCQVQQSLGLIKLETGNVGFCGWRMTKERESERWKALSARKKMVSTCNFWISERSEKQQAYSAQDSQQCDRQVPKHFGSTTNYSVKASLLPSWWI